MQHTELSTPSSSTIDAKFDFYRIKANFAGRFMLEDQSEYPCTVTEVSPVNVLFKAEHAARNNEKVIAYIDHIGRIEGSVTRQSQTGFVLAINASERKRNKLAVQLTRLSKSLPEGRPEGRRHERTVPQSPYTVLAMTDGRQYRCRILDLSLSGAAIQIDVRPIVGSSVTLGNMSGHVVRHFEGGIAIEFSSIQTKPVLKAS